VGFQRGRDSIGRHDAAFVNEGAKFLGLDIRIQHVRVAGRAYAAKDEETDSPDEIFPQNASR
jgi:hypothetical protein